MNIEALRTRLGLVSAALSLLPAAATAGTYDDVIARVTSMPHDAELQQRVARHGLNVVNVMWEDTGRDLGSAIGPNISDMTLQVRQRRGRETVTHLLPVIRYPNFSDTTADIAADKLWVRVGNQRKGAPLTEAPLTEVLRNLRQYLTDASSLRGSGNLLAARDTHFLVSAQHVFVPIPKGGKAEFNPVLFNYQSAPGSPAVLTLLVTRQGTSATIIENRGGGQSYQTWGQELFFNNAGERTVFTAERRSDVQERVSAGKATSQDAGALDPGADMVMVVQVPLVHRNIGFLGGVAAQPAPMAPSAAAEAPSMARRAEPRSDVENAVIGHGENEGVFAEAGHYALERDATFPVRVTVQFYRATSNGVVSDGDLRDVRAMIDRVYSDGDFVGSLVTGSQARPTAWPKPRPDQWGRWGRWQGVGSSVYVQ